MIELHREALRDACRALAACVYPNAMSADIAETLAHQFEETALRHVEFTAALGRDPNIVTRAVRYLGEAHGMPARGTDVLWFGHMLDCVLELAVPSMLYDGQALAFLEDIADGVTQAIEDARA